MKSTAHSLLLIQIVIVAAGCGKSQFESVKVTGNDGNTIQNTMAASVLYGDMLLDQDPNPSAKEGSPLIAQSASGLKAFNTKLWKNGRVPLRFDSGISRQEREVIFKACKKFSAAAKVSCHSWDGEKNYVSVTGYPEYGCLGAVGAGKSRNAARPLNLAPGCWSSKTILHELGHIFGFIHEHQRPGRDRYIKILSKNILSGHDSGFDKLELGTNDESSVYDFASIMHYGLKEFSKNGKPTMELRPEYREYKDIVGRPRNTLSRYDKQTMAKLYGEP